MNLTDIDKAYIAGFFDGEGCVGYYNASKINSSRPGYFHVSVSVSNTDPRVIFWIQQVTGLGKSKIIHFRDGKRRIAYQWQIGKKEDVVLFLSTIRSYLRVKGDQVDVVLAHLTMEADYVKKHGSVTPEVVKSRQDVSDILKEMKRAVFLESVETRQVGPSIH